MRYSIIVIILLCSVSWSDWSRVDDIYYNTNSMVNLQEYTYNALQQYVNGYGSSGIHQNIGAVTLNNELYLRINDIAFGTTTKYERNQEGNITRVVEVNPFSERNETFFDLSEYAKDNTQAYGDYIGSYFTSNGNIIVDNYEKPDDFFLQNPNYGNMFYHIGNKISQDGFGIEDIKNSQQTKEIRDEVAKVETKMKGMFTTDYTNSVLNYDFSELGNYFITVNHWTTNPFLNLKGSLRIKPLPQDMHYAIWHRYFDRSYSNYALALKFGLHTVMFLAFTLYVINDLMAIVDA